MPSASPTRSAVRSTGCGLTSRPGGREVRSARSPCRDGCFGRGCGRGRANRTRPSRPWPWPRRYLPENFRKVPGPCRPSVVWLLWASPTPAGQPPARRCIPATAATGQRPELAPAHTLPATGAAGEPDRPPARRSPRLPVPGGAPETLRFPSGRKTGPTIGRVRFVGSYFFCSVRLIAADDTVGQDGRRPRHDRAWSRAPHRPMCPPCPSPCCGAWGADRPPTAGTHLRATDVSA